MKIGYFYSQEEFDLIGIPPTPLALPPSNSMRRCPALKDVIKNTYVIKCPYDIHLTFKNFNDNGFPTIYLDPEESTLRDAAFGTFIILLEDTTWSAKDIPIIQFKTSIVFVTDEKGLTIEGFPPFLDYRPNLPIRTAAFKFNLYNWVRACDCGMEWMDLSKPIIFKRGDPLMYIRFNTDKNVKLEKIEKTEQLDKLEKRNKSVRNIVDNLTVHAMLMAGKTRPKRLLP